MKKATKIILIIAVIILLILIFIMVWARLKCGDDICQKWEKKQGNCPIDCIIKPLSPAATPPASINPVCGNGFCETTENTENCPADCSLDDTLPQAKPTSTTNYLLRIAATCKLPIDQEHYVLLETTTHKFVIVRLNPDEKKQFEDKECVERISTAAEARKRFESLPKELQDSIQEIVKQYHLAKSVKQEDLPDRKELLKTLKEEQPVLPSGTTSHYQLYVTPKDPAVTSLAQGILNPLDIYQEAVSWVWVAEETLNRVEEKWLKPNEFIVDTPSYATNPVRGKIASDCSEQANTLVSLFRAAGFSAEYVRVVLGEVDFDGEVGGHAWVQFYQDGVWVDLDPTSGPYWDDATKKLVASDGLPWNYFKFFPFPVNEVWVYYNDLYYYDVETKQGTAPKIWY